MKHTLTAVGLGPGDPELITVKGQRAVQNADLIFVPRSQDGDQSLALRIAKAWLDRERQQVVELPLPMTRNSDRLVAAWQGAAQKIADSFSKHSENEAVHGVYLLLGDPLLYGTFTYIWQALAEAEPAITVDIIPGVTSFAAAAATAQVVLSATSDRVAILPASYETDTTSLRQLLSDFDTVILMKVGPVLPQIVQSLESLNLLDTAVYAERVGMPEERLIRGPDILALGKAPQPYLSLLIIRQA